MSEFSNISARFSGMKEGESSKSLITSITCLMLRHLPLPGFSFVRLFLLILFLIIDDEKRLHKAVERRLSNCCVQSHQRKQAKTARRTRKYLFIKHNK